MSGKPWRMREVCQQSTNLNVQRGHQARPLLTFLVILTRFNTRRKRLGRVIVILVKREESGLGEGNSEGGNCEQWVWASC